jgi:hypothetical protein
MVAPLRGADLPHHPLSAIHQSLGFYEVRTVIRRSIRGAGQ